MDGSAPSFQGRPRYGQGTAARNRSARWGPARCSISIDLGSLPYHWLPLAPHWLALRSHSTPAHLSFILFSPAFRLPNVCRCLGEEETTSPRRHGVVSSEVVLLLCYEFLASLANSTSLSSFFVLLFTYQQHSFCPVVWTRPACERSAALPFAASVPHSRAPNSLGL